MKAMLKMKAKAPNLEQECDTKAQRSSEHRLEPKWPRREIHFALRVVGCPPSPDGQLPQLIKDLHPATFLLGTHPRAASQAVMYFEKIMKNYELNVRTIAIVSLLGSLGRVPGSTPEGGCLLHKSPSGGDGVG